MVMAASSYIGDPLEWILLFVSPQKTVLTISRDGGAVSWLCVAVNQPATGPDERAGGSSATDLGIWIAKAARCPEANGERGVSG